jgi:hypothetical protein
MNTHQTAFFSGAVALGLVATVFAAVPAKPQMAAEQTLPRVVVIGHIAPEQTLPRVVVMGHKADADNLIASNSKPAARG